MRMRFGRVAGAVTAVMVLIVCGVVGFFGATPASADHSFIMPAEENGCAVDIQVEAEHSVDRNPIGYGDITFTNLETGATYLWKSRYYETETYDPSTGNWHILTIGKKWTPLYAGEPGPAGIVEEPGAELLTTGRLEYTLTSEGVLIAFSLEGTYLDLCEQLSD